MDKPYYLYIGIVVSLLILVFGYKVLLRVFGIVIVPDGKMGIVTKKFVLFGKNQILQTGQIIALNGEAGVQADMLAQGLHFWLWPWQYSIDQIDPYVIEKNEIGLVQALDGVPIEVGRVLGKHVDCNAFQDARMFFEGNGERGPQVTIIPPGNYRINTKVFKVTKGEATIIEGDKIGIVTVKEGASLPEGEIACGVIPGHSTFQNGQAFLDNKGCKGLQEEVLRGGTYYINPLFATVDEDIYTLVEIAHVGVVISYVGESSADLTGDQFKHGNLVKNGDRGVWIDPLDPGKYPINTRTHRVEQVPSANIVLNWADARSESHNLDEDLSTIKVRSSDGFDYTMDVSQIIHVPRTDAPKVIAQFGEMKNLVSQVLEPTIGNYFRNAAQGSDAIDFLKNRTARQFDAKEAITAALKDYSVGAIDTLVGDIVPPPSLMKTLTDRKIAEQEQETYKTQKLAQEERKGLEQAKAIADTQKDVVTAERSVEIAKFSAESAVNKSEGEAQAKRVNAEADAMVLKTVGAAQAEKIQKIGTAESDVMANKIKSVGAENFARIEVARTLSENHVKITPDIIAGGNGGSSMAETFVAMMIKDGLNKNDEAKDNKVEPEVKPVVEPEIKPTEEAK